MMGASSAGWAHACSFFRQQQHSSSCVCIRVYEYIYVDLVTLSHHNIIIIDIVIGPYREVAFAGTRERPELRFEEVCM